MKNQVIEINYTVMLYAGIMYTSLVISGWLLIRLTIACFKLPTILRNAEQLLQGPLDKDQQTSITGKNYEIEIDFIIVGVRARAPVCAYKHV